VTLTTENDNNDLNGLLHNFVGSNVNFSYAFDSVGQMLSQRTSDPANFRWTPGAPGTVSYGTANNINQYPTVGGVGFSYSTDGNLINDGVFKYEFNTERMMTRVRDAGTNAIIADYLYDPALRQRQKNVGGTKTNFYYAGWQRLADYDGTTNTLQQRFVYGPGLDEVLIQISSGGTKTYFHGNHQGSVIATTDATGTVLNRFKYSPYGESPSMTGTSHGYTGQRYDSETGLYYCKMRYYSPKFGRFLQADPIGYKAGLNMYSYVANAPTVFGDSLGLRPPMGLTAPARTTPARPYGTGDGVHYVGNPHVAVANLKVTLLEYQIDGLPFHHAALLLEATDIVTGAHTETVIEMFPSDSSAFLQMTDQVPIEPHIYSLAESMGHHSFAGAPAFAVQAIEISTGLWGKTWGVNDLIGTDVFEGDPLGYSKILNAARELNAEIAAADTKYTLPLIYPNYYLGNRMNSNQYIAEILRRSGYASKIPVFDQFQMPGIAEPVYPGGKAPSSDQSAFSSTSSDSSTMQK